jgi:hypothetical protein
MYEIRCPECGRIGFHPSRVGAESQAERHEQKTDHVVGVDAMETA